MHYVISWMFILATVLFLVGCSQAPPSKQTSEWPAGLVPSYAQRSELKSYEFLTQEDGDVWQVYILNYGRQDMTSYRIKRDYRYSFDEKNIERVEHDLSLDEQLLVACQREDTTIEQIQSLLDAGASVNVRSGIWKSPQTPLLFGYIGSTPLMLASENNQDPEIIACLIDAGAYVHVRNKVGETPLMYAAKSNPNPDVISVLIESGARVDVRDDRGRTPLMLASGGNSRSDIVSELLQAGSELEARNKSGETALMYAAHLNENPDMISVLIEAGADVDATCNSDLTPLMFSVGFNCNPEVVTALLNAGADVNQRSDEGYTPLLAAASPFCVPDPEVIEVLLNAGADVNQMSDDGRTPLLAAVNSIHDLDPEVIEALLNAGADVTVKDKDGKTALDYAEESDFLQQSSRVYRKLSNAYSKQMQNKVQ